MGINNTRYDRVTVYLKGSQRTFFDELIKYLSEKGVSVPSRSDLIRAVIDEMTGATDWKTKPLVDAINDFRIRRQIDV